MQVESASHGKFFALDGVEEHVEEVTEHALVLKVQKHEAALYLRPATACSPRMANNGEEKVRQHARVWGPFNVPRTWLAVSRTDRQREKDGDVGASSRRNTDMRSPKML